MGQRFFGWDTKNMMSLEKRCLDVIVCEFERFHFAYKISDDDAYLKRLLEILQRVYSDRIAELLFEKNKRICYQHIDFVVNKYSKSLQTEWLKDLPWGTIAAKFAEMGSNLECLHFKNDLRPWKKIICHLSHMVIGTFYTNCNDEILKRIAKFCPNIVEIDASLSHAVTDTGIKYLCIKENGKLPCTKLKKINIKCCRVTEAGVAHLIKNLHSLEEIEYFDFPKVLYFLHKIDLSRLDKIEPYNITNLNFYDLYKKPFYTDILKICLSLCPRLKSLSCYVLTEEHLDLFHSLNELKRLELNCNSHALDINNLLKLIGRRLTSVSLEYCSISLSNVFKNCPYLTRLSFTAVKFENKSDNSPVFKRLKSRVSTPFVYGTAGSGSSVLEEITFHWCDFSTFEFKAEVLRCFGHYPIKNIEITHSDVEMEFLKGILVECYSLKCLSLMQCALDDEKVLIYTFAKVLPNNPEINISFDNIHGVGYDNSFVYDLFYHNDLLR